MKSVLIGLVNISGQFFQLILSEKMVYSNIELALICSQYSLRKQNRERQFNISFSKGLEFFNHAPLRQLKGFPIKL